MKVFAIRNAEDKRPKDLAYLLYYEQAKAFYIEIPQDADEWKVPLILDSFVKMGEYTVNAYWSKRWVEERIVPADRQNLGGILKANHLEEYDEFSLLMLGEGRCAQDEYYLVPLEDSQFPQLLKDRYSKKVVDVVPLANYKLLVFFRDGLIKKIDLKKTAQKQVKKLHASYRQTEWSVVLANEEIFKSVSIQTDGYGICWGESVVISDAFLYDAGEKVPLSRDDFLSFISNRVVNSAEAAQLLNCSRQNIDDLVKRNKLTPIKSTPKNKLFLKSDVMERGWL